METAKLKKFAQFARRSLLEQVSAKLKLVLAENSAARRERGEAIKKLEEAIKNHGKEQVIERVAYIWFNRFCALRFMDVNRYTRIGVVSPAEGQFQPEILAEAKMGHIDEEMAHDKVRQQIFALLDGKAPSRDPQGEAYRLLVVAACNFWNKAMPFLFQRIDDYTELLMPDDLLSGNSILAYTREAMTPDACGAGSHQSSAASNQNGKTDGYGLMADGSAAAAGGVEVIGWLYQFYISEKKDEVFDGLKKNKKITPENIPAATQLFTPHWIVKYLVENSLGRLWMLNRPNSRLVDRMEYYIRPDTSCQPTVVSNQQENTDGCTLSTDYLRVSSPEEIRICDPACGSGHMLTYAFDLLYAIYEEEGYEPADIPEKILTHNLYGIEIDERAGELAAFALTMKARAKQRQFFNKGVKPNICVLENVHFDEGELKNYMDFVGRDLFTYPLQSTLRQFEEVDNFGSLIRPDVTDVDGMLRILESKNVSGQLFISMTHQKVLQALRQADYLGPKYHVVIANPPYMGGKGMNGRLAAWVKDNYPNSKSDLFAMFIERNLDLAQRHGAVAMITMQSWMFLSSFEALRARILRQNTLLSMAHLGARAFDSIGGEVVSTTAFVLGNANRLNYKGGYLRLVAGNSEAEKNDAILKAVKNSNCGLLYRASATDFKKIPGSPIAYWANEKICNLFFETPSIGDISSPRQGIKTGENDKFLRLWYEVGVGRANVFSKDKASDRWFACIKGGEYRKWYGNHEYFLKWEDNGREIKNFKDENGKLRSRPQNIEYFFRHGVAWTKMSNSPLCARLFPDGFTFESNGPVCFPNDSSDNLLILGLFNSNIFTYLIRFVSANIDYGEGDIKRVPFLKALNFKSAPITNLINLGKDDWDFYETSWDFTSQPLLNPDYRQPTLKATYQRLRVHWREMTQVMQRLEEENNRIFIEAYGLQDELKPEVPLNEITLTCNPHYRYGKGSNQSSAISDQQRQIHPFTEDCTPTADGFSENAELEARLLQDTMKELVSYAVGCMFGRYSLDATGLILANQGEGIDDYWPIIRMKRERPDSHQLSAISNHPETNDAFSDNWKLSSEGFSSGFQPDEDNVIPILDGDWFTDDIAERFRKFLRVAFGEEHYEENLQFVENALGKNGKARDIRDYFLKDFYTDHVKRYKKRPIYWLFSSPKGSFNALIYMHRYRPDTVSVVLNDYLREFRIKLTSHKNHLEAVSINASASQGEKTKALKQIEKITRMIAELETYERDVLYPLATHQLEIDLDDGVKVNYPKFGAALKKIVGLEAKED